MEINTYFMDKKTSSELITYPLYDKLCTAWWESLAGECLVNLLFQAFGGISFAMNRSAKGLLIVITTLDGFSLVNHRKFAKFAKL